MYKGFALLFAVVFLFLGAVGFVPFLVSEGFLFKFLKVNAATNLIHLLIGLVALWVAFTKSYYTRLYFQIVGFVLAVYAIFGFIYGKSPVLGFIANNPPLTWFHVIFGILALILGYGFNNIVEQRKKT